MTGKVIDSSATGLLILILPFAVLIVLLFKFWPVILALFILSISFSVWQQYQWKQWSKQVNPYFNELIKENQGCLTAVDLSMKANLSGSAARQYLDKKAEEFGAQRQVYEDKGTVYYFLTASALGSIFDESEPPLELQSESFTSQSSKLFEPLKQKEAIPSKSESSTGDVPEPLESPVEEESNPSESVSLRGEVEEDLEPLAQQKHDPRDSIKQEEDLWADSPDKEQKASQSLIQAELAKRLDVHSSTVGKRKSDPDFSEWSQSRDPEGIPWEYSPDTKEFLPVQKKPESLT